MADRLTAKFVTERETKNTVRFREDGPEDQHKIGTLYVQKSELQKLGNPNKLLVTVEAGV